MKGVAAATWCVKYQFISLEFLERISERYYRRETFTTSKRAEMGIPSQAWGNTIRSVTWLACMKNDAIQALDFVTGQSLTRLEQLQTRGVAWIEWMLRQSDRWPTSNLPRREFWNRSSIWRWPSVSNDVLSKPSIMVNIVSQVANNAIL